MLVLGFLFILNIVGRGVTGGTNRNLGQVGRCLKRLSCKPMAELTKRDCALGYSIVDTCNPICP